MQLLIVNTTGSTRTYLSGAISVLANSSTAITNTTQQLSLSTDGSLHSDISAGLANISDGTTVFGNTDAFVYLNLIPGILGPNSDALGNNLTSSTITSGTKQALDTTQQKMPLTVSSPATATVGVSSSTVLSLNTNRKGMCIINVSLSKVSFAIGTTAVLNSGITLYPGGVWVMDDYTYATGAINAIASIASSVISIQEFTV